MQVFSSLSAGSRAVEQLNRQLDIDQLEEIKDKIEEQQQDMEEKQEFFVRAGQIDNEDELMDELNELEAEMAMEDFEGVDIASGSIEANHAPA